MDFAEYVTTVWESEHPIYKELKGRNLSIPFNDIDWLCNQKVDWLYYFLKTRDIDSITDEVIEQVFSDLITYFVSCTNNPQNIRNVYNEPAILTMDFFKLYQKLFGSNKKFIDMDDKLFESVRIPLLFAIEKKKFNLPTVLSKFFSWVSFRYDYYDYFGVPFNVNEASILFAITRNYRQELNDYRRNNYGDMAWLAKSSVWIYKNVKDISSKIADIVKELAVDCCRDAYVAAKDGGFPENIVRIENAITTLQQGNIPELDLKKEIEEIDIAQCVDQGVFDSGLKSYFGNYIVKNNAKLDSKYKAFSKKVCDLEIEDLTEEEFKEELKKYDILLITANSCEDRVITQKLYEENGNKAILKQIIEVYRVDLSNIANVKVAHVHQTHMGSSSDEGSEATVIDMVKYFRPKLVISIGVAYGIDYLKQEIGDVLFSSKIIDVDKWNKMSEEVIELEADNIYKANQRICASWGHYFDSYDDARTEDPKWLLGPMLSKGSVLNDCKAKKELLDAARRIGERSVIGGEMEGSGIVRACKREKLRWIIIKGICDFGESKNDLGKIAKEYGLTESNEKLKDSMQYLAAENAFLALKKVLTEASSALKDDKDEYSAT